MHFIGVLVLIFAQARTESNETELIPIREPTFTLLISPRKKFEWIQLYNNTASPLTIQFGPIIVPEGEQLCLYVKTEPIAGVKFKRDEAFLCFKETPKFPVNLHHIPPGETTVAGYSIRHVNQTSNIKPTPKLLLDPKTFEVYVNDTRILWHRTQEHFTPVYEWTTFMPWHVLPLGSDIKWHFTDPRQSIARIPEEWQLQIFLGPNFRLIKFIVSRDTLGEEILAKTSEISGVDRGCLFLWDFERGQAIDPRTTIEEMNWFLRRRDVQVLIHQSGLCLNPRPSRCGAYFRPPERKGQSDRCETSTIEFWRLYRSGALENFLKIRP